MDHTPREPIVEELETFRVTQDHKKVKRHPKHAQLPPLVEPESLQLRSSRLYCWNGSALEEEQKDNPG